MCRNSANVRYPTDIYRLIFTLFTILRTDPKIYCMHKAPFSPCQIKILFRGWNSATHDLIFTTRVGIERIGRVRCTFFGINWWMEWSRCKTCSSFMSEISDGYASLRIIYSLWIPGYGSASNAEVIHAIMQRHEVVGGLKMQAKLWRSWNRWQTDLAIRGQGKLYV